MAKNVNALGLIHGGKGITVSTLAEDRTFTDL